MVDLKKYRDCNYIDEIYEYSIDSFEFSRRNLGGYCTGVFLSFALMIINLPFRVRIDKEERVGITRGVLHKQTLTRSLGEMLIINDDIINHDFTIYRIGKRNERIFFFLFSFFKKCIHDKKDINTILSEIELTKAKKKELRKFLFKRIAHTCYFSWAIDLYLKQSQVKEVCVSYTHDRFALVTEQICKNNNIMLICVPHGEIENKNLPRKYPGDKVYLLNEQLVRLFNKAYDTDAYVYDYNVLKRIYELDCKNVKGGKIVYLMTPYFYVDEQLDCIDNMAEFLKKRNVRLYVKQHPACKYNISKYDNIEELSTLEEAVCKNLCVGFFTTALIDAVFNNSKAVSILKVLDEKVLYQKNKEVFEGSGVICVESENDLLNTMENYLAGVKQ